MTAATDTFARNATGLSSPARNAVAFTKSDSNNFTNVSRAIYVGTTGDVAVIMAGGDGSTAVVIPSVPAGAILPIQASRINSTGTTASGFVVLW